MFARVVPHVKLLFCYSPLALTHIYPLHLCPSLFGPSSNFIPFPVYPKFVEFKSFGSRRYFSDYTFRVPRQNRFGSISMAAKRKPESRDQLPSVSSEKRSLQPNTTRSRKSSSKLLKRDMAFELIKNEHEFIAQGSELQTANKSIEPLGGSELQTANESTEPLGFELQTPTKDSPSFTELLDPRCLVKARRIQNTLDTLYPHPPQTFLDAIPGNPFTLLVAVMLSAQCTDAKVNKVLPSLFQIADTPHKMAECTEEQIKTCIQSLGLANTKAKNLLALSKQLLQVYQGVLPQTMQDLIQLPGVGRKTASVVLAQAFAIPAFPVDTHIHRLACRWGIGDAKSVDKTESALKLWFPEPSLWLRLHIQIILFGREHCPASGHDMTACPICAWAATPESFVNNNSRKFTPASRHKHPYFIREDYINMEDPLISHSRADTGIDGVDPGGEKKVISVSKSKKRRAQSDTAIVENKIAQPGKKQKSAAIDKKTVSHKLDDQHSVSKRATRSTSRKKQ